MAQAGLDVCSLDLVHVVIDRELRIERYVQSQLAIDLDGIGIAGQKTKVVRRIGAVRIDVGRRAASESGLADGVADLGVGIKLGEIEAGRPSALADVIIQIIILSEIDVGPSPKRYRCI